jgi:hypothetical protein
MKGLSFVCHFGAVLVACTSCHAGKYTKALNLAISCGPFGNASCPSRQSSTAVTYVASIANDGIIPPQPDRIFTSTNYELRPWWRVDFGSSQAIGGITIYNRAAGDRCCPTRLDGFQVWVGANSTFDGAGNFMCYKSTAADDVAHNVYPFIQSFSCVGVGQYLFVTLPIVQFLSLAEVLIYPPCNDCSAGTYSSYALQQCSICSTGYFSETGMNSAYYADRSQHIVSDKLRMTIRLKSIR